MTAIPFALPQKLQPELGSILSYWQGLERRDAKMPFWDDVKLSTLGELAGWVVLLDVLDQPARFRFALGGIGNEVHAAYGGDLSGKFVDEIEVRTPLDFLLAQANATVEGRQPTWYGHNGGTPAYTRLLLPLWGNGRIGMLIGAFAFA